jgi:hypothetical protein
MNGYGVFHFAIGNIYDGNWEDDLFSGFGVMKNDA